MRSWVVLISSKGNHAAVSLLPSSGFHGDVIVLCLPRPRAPLGYPRHISIGAGWEKARRVNRLVSLGTNPPTENKIHRLSDLAEATLCALSQPSSGTGVICSLNDGDKHLA